MRFSFEGTTQELSDLLTQIRGIRSTGTFVPLKWKYLKKVFFYKVWGQLSKTRRVRRSRTARRGPPLKTSGNGKRSANSWRRRRPFQLPWSMKWKVPRSRWKRKRRTNRRPKRIKGENLIRGMTPPPDYCFLLIFLILLINFNVNVIGICIW